jgi:NAD(P)-dependent dehydrogenase (short-subunit alcohol dehydrogenase family)
MSPERNRTIILTGATRGLGRVMAQGFAARGHTVLGCGRSEGKLDSLRDELGAPHDFEVVDVATDADVQRWARRLLSDFGAPDLIVNNAALMNESAPLWEVPAEELSALLEVNLGGTVNVIRHFVPAMLKAGQGVIVNFSSGWGKVTSPHVAPYCATKWGIEGLTRALAQELPSGLAAVPLNPGIVNTEMLQTCWGSDADAYPDADTWGEVAVPFILGLGPKDSGSTRNVPL